MVDALVLKTSPYSESTLIVWLLTREEGVARVLAKGARKMKGGAAAALDLHTQVRASLRMPARDGLGILRSIETERTWGYLRRDLKRLALVSVAMEILGAVAATSAHEAYFFEEAVDYITRMEEAAAPGSLTAALLMRLLHHAGHPPQLDESLKQEALLPEKLVFDFSEGTILKPDERAGGFGNGKRMGLTGKLVQTLRSALEGPPPLDERFVLPTREGIAALRWLIQIWEDHLNQKLQSAHFLEQTVFSESA